MGLSAAVVTARTSVVDAALCSDVTRHEMALRHYRRRIPSPSDELFTEFLLPSSSLHRWLRSLAVAGRIVPSVATKLNRFATRLRLSGSGSGPASFTSNDGARNCPKSLVASINCSHAQVAHLTQTVRPERGIDLSTNQRKRTSYESQR
jgi:hypothetical protein